MTDDIRSLITTLGLQQLPGEGGYFRRTWESGSRIGGRAAASAIYYLLTREDFSALHRLDADETWHHYAGDAVEHFQFDADARRLEKTRLGSNVPAGERPQVCVPAGIWQGARLQSGGPVGWALLGCTVTPAWTLEGFALAPAGLLENLFPDERPLIRTVTR